MLRMRYATAFAHRIPADPLLVDSRLTAFDPKQPFRAQCDET